MDEPTPEDSMPDPTGITSSNKIIEITAHTRDLDIPHGSYTPLDATPEMFASLADQLAALGADEQSAQLEIIRRELADDPEATLRFTARQLTSIVIPLAIASVVNVYEKQQDLNDPIKAFGHLIDESTDSPLDGDYADLDIDGLEPLEDDYVDPFAVIKGHQTVQFTDDAGDVSVPGV